MIKYFSKIRNPFILFLPLLIFYIGIILKSPTYGTEGDEPRYLRFAENLLNGFYSTPPPNIDLWNGPGYPIFLMPFVVLKLPLICITLMNGFLYYFTNIILYKILQQFVSFKKAIIFTLFWACYYIAYAEMILIYSEVLTTFLISLLLYCLIKAFKVSNSGKKYTVLSGLIMGYIVLVKVIFGYVILLMTLVIGALWIIKRQKLSLQRGVLIMLIALATISPYLIYTYKLTGKVYYLGNSGGMSLYWMSTPYANELGDWYHERNIKHIDTLNLVINEGSKAIPGFQNYLFKNHAIDYIELDKYVGVERDAIYKKIAINNIKNHPIKYLKNCFSNIERLFFSFPFSYSLQHSSIKLAFTGIILIGMLFSMIVTLINWKRIPFFIRFLLLYIILYLALTVLVSTYIRMFTVIVPVLLFWIAYILEKSIKINFRFKQQENFIS